MLIALRPGQLIRQVLPESRKVCDRAAQRSSRVAIQHQHYVADRDDIARVQKLRTLYADSVETDAVVTTGILDEQRFLLPKDS